MLDDKIVRSIMDYKKGSGVKVNGKLADKIKGIREADKEEQKESERAKRDYNALITAMGSLYVDVSLETLKLKGIDPDELYERVLGEFSKSDYMKSQKGTLDQCLHDFNQSYKGNAKKNPALLKDPLLDLKKALECAGGNYEKLQAISKPRGFKKS